MVAKRRAPDAALHDIKVAHTIGSATWTLADQIQALKGRLEKVSRAQALHEVQLKALELRVMAYIARLDKLMLT